ncbi:MAG: type I-U CRISPR-associated protein Csx17 [Opitutaceae bacterium]|nr:type I-U CRISPR-associated protein Csx17 [Opitutaceae bacterium]
MPDHLELPGCRHDILGYYLKAIGLLRVLAKCAAPEHRDPDAEGWWDISKACFCLRSTKYDTLEKLAQFFAKHYRPTPIFAAWNKESGSSAKDSKNLGLFDDWKLASDLSATVVSPEDWRKSTNRDKRIASEALTAYRDTASAEVSEALDSISASFLKSSSDHPLFLSKGIAGRAHLWRTHWEYLADFQKCREACTKAAEKSATSRGGSKQSASSKKRTDTGLQPIQDQLPSGAGRAALLKGKGTPFFPDAIKAYNTGPGWVTEKYPFNALDYILAVEGGFSMRGSVGRTLAANSRRFAAFPFVFDTGEELVDDANEVKGTASALWFPLWDRPATFAELSSFITDAQARLPGREARFNAEFMRALHCQGIDAGFTGWQEFRFRMQISRVPWITTGSYVESVFREDANRLNQALHRFDESQFLDQFEIKMKGGKADSKSPHPVRAAINAAMETAARETTPHHCLDLLSTIFRACSQMAISQTFRDTLPEKRARFFRPLPMRDWNALIRNLDEPEFRIARAVASVVGQMRQWDKTYSEVLPMLGSLLPLKLGPGGWYLPKKSERSHQAAWTGTDLCHDLASVLARRYMDSLTDDRPALVSSSGAPLKDVLAFLHGDLDDHLIARWIEALSLIGWQSENLECESDAENQHPAIPPEYAALRTLLELECELQGQDPSKWTKRRSQQPIALLCHRSGSTLPLAVAESLRWIAIWGVPNPFKNRHEKPRLAGRDIINLTRFSPSIDISRLAAAVSIPLHRSDRFALYRTITLPQAV